MKPTLTLLTIQLLVQFAVSHAVEAPWLQPPQHFGEAKAEHAVTNRAFQGIPSMAVAPHGRLWANWYAGVTPGEDQNNYVVVSTSGDGGKTWREVLVIDPDGPGPVRAFDPELWVSPDDRLFVFWAQAEGHLGTVAGVWCVETSRPDSDRPRWSKPRRLTDGIMMCKPIALSTGEWVLPASTWRETDNSARLIVSTDKGATWSLRGGCNVPKEARQFDEHMLIERRNGSLWMLARTKYGIGESVSTDGGRTWPELRPAAIPHADARFFIRRLNSGSLLLVKHGGMDQPVTVRSHLTAFLSKDEGKTWTGGLMLDERKGVSYPDGQQTADGLIRIIYDHGRVGRYRQILMATFREEDVLAGKDVSRAVKLRQVVSEASGGRDTDQNKDGVPIKLEPSGILAFEGVQAEPLTGGVLLFKDRPYTLTQFPQALAGARFLPVPMNGEKSLRCTRAGNVWFLTPTPKRNKDSQTARLLEQGFQKVAVPEVRLFLPRAEGNYEFATLYQKVCKAGEVVTIGKWAVPVFLPLSAQESAGRPSGIPTFSGPTPGTLRTISIPTVDISGDTRRHVIVARGTDKDYQGHCDTVLMADGKTMFAAWCMNHAGHLGPLARSEDGGLTWSAPLSVPSNWQEVKNTTPVLHRLTDSRGVERLFIFGGCDFPGNIRSAFSEDGGKTWSPMVEIGVVGEVAPKSILPFDGGKRLIMWSDRRDPKNAKDPHPVVWQSESADGGLTWSKERVILVVPGQWAQPSVTRSADGRRLLMLMRENTRKHQSLYSVSTDDARTWSEPKELPAALTGDRHVIKRAPDGRLVVAFRDMVKVSPTYGHYVAWVGTFEDIENRREGQYRIKLLHNANRTAADAPGAGNTDCGYSDLELLGDGTIIATTYIKYAAGPEKNSVVSTRFKLSETDAMAKQVKN